MCTHNTHKSIKTAVPLDEQGEQQALSLLSDICGAIRHLRCYQTSAVQVLCFAEMAPKGYNWY
jgi:hypothetical protein